MDFTSPAQNGAHATHPKRIFDKPAYKTNKKKAVTDTIYATKRTHPRQIAK